MKLNELGEDAVVQGLTRGLKLNRRVILGPGDDCAVVKTAGNLQLLKSDCVIEGIHFLPDADPMWVGWKAMCLLMLWSVSRSVLKLSLNG
jgi:thiamine-monophosphate kinase